jgi:zinc transporter ZupT
MTISIFFHELPHEIGDFSYLLKQKVGKFKALFFQIFSGLAAFLGVYLSKFIYLVSFWYIIGIVFIGYSCNK